MTTPAILGGEPAFPSGLPFVRPAVPPLDRVVARLTPSYERGRLTNGPLVEELEHEVAGRLGVEYVVAVASCTAGLMLAIRALAPGRRALVPSFTFSATAHAAAWNSCPIVFAECDPATFHLDVDDADRRSEGVGLVIATHTFGSPCSVEALEALAQRRGAALLLDAAHAIGATRRGRAVGQFGDAEVFSLSPTKPVVAGEGGLVTTNRADVAEGVRAGRDYGNPGDYDTRFVGLNARMSELHAAVALESLAELDPHLARRRELVARYRDGLAGVPGTRLQEIDGRDSSTWKDLTIAIDEAGFGIGRDDLVAALGAEGIDTRCYFDPPVHRQQAYRTADPAPLPVTDRLAASVVSLPIYRDLPLEAVDRVVGAVTAAHRSAAEIGDRSARVRTP